MQTRLQKLNSDSQIGSETVKSVEETTNVQNKVAPFETCWFQWETFTLKGVIVCRLGTQLQTQESKNEVHVQGNIISAVGVAQDNTLEGKKML